MCKSMTACWNLDCVCVYFRLHQHYCFIRWKRFWCGQLRQEISCEKPQWSPETGTMLFIYIFVSTGIAFLRYENEIGLENLGINKSRKNMTVWNQDWVVCLSAMFREKSAYWKWGAQQPFWNRLLMELKFLSCKL